MNVSHHRNFGDLFRECEAEVVWLHHGVHIDTLASWQDPQYGGVSPPPRKKLKQSSEDTTPATDNMQQQNQHQQQQQASSNGSGEVQQNGMGHTDNCEENNTQTQNGVTEEETPPKLSVVQQEMVRLIGQHLIELGLKYVLYHA